MEEWVGALEQQELVGVEEAAGGGEGLEQVLGLDDGVLGAEAGDLFVDEGGVVGG